MSRDTVKQACPEMMYYMPDIDNFFIIFFFEGLTITLSIDNYLAFTLPFGFIVYGAVGLPGSILGNNRQNFIPARHAALSNIFICLI